MAMWRVGSVGRGVGPKQAIGGSEQSAGYGTLSSWARGESGNSGQRRPVRHLLRLASSVHVEPRRAMSALMMEKVPLFTPEESRYAGLQSRFSEEDMQGLEKVFHRHDEFKRGGLSLGQVRHAVDSLGFRIPYFVLEGALTRLRFGKNDQVQLNEFLLLVATLREAQRRYPAVTPDNTATNFDGFTRVFDEYLGEAIVEYSEMHVEEPRVIFEDVWNNLLARFSAERMMFPREIVWLGGAPGAGKGTNTPFITYARQFTAKPIVMSDLLGERFSAIKNSGGLVTDRLVLEVLLEALLDPKYRSGVIVDGFPRTETQVHCVTQLRDRMYELRSRFLNTSRASSFPRPFFFVAIFFVDEEESVRRQLSRGDRTRKHNEEVKRLGVGELLAERNTDFDPEVARHRYRIFADHYRTVNRMKQHFNFAVINAMGSLSDVQKRIESEFAYQSRQELSAATFDLIHGIPLSDEIRQNARQDLIARLDAYGNEHVTLFCQVIGAVLVEVMPQIRKFAISGECKAVVRNPLFDNPLCERMALDILNERGFYVHQHPSTVKGSIIWHIKWEPVRVRSSVGVSAAVNTN